MQVFELGLHCMSAQTKKETEKKQKEKYGMHTVKHINEVAVSGGKGRIELDLNLCFFESVDVPVF